jgi:hypothetical protein
MADKDDTFFKELVEHHVSGKLKVAPEHVSKEALKYMGKPAGETYDKFVEKFKKITEKLGKKQYIIPYLMSSHPGSTLDCAIELAEYLRDTNYQPEQVQDFYPTPGTPATTMYYTGLDPMTMKEVYVPKTKHEKAMQRALLQFKNPKYYTLVYEALTEAGRTDLIGNGSKCLIRDKTQGYNGSSTGAYRKSQVKTDNNNSSYKGVGNVKEKNRSKTGRTTDKNSIVQGRIKDKNESKNIDKTQSKRGKSNKIIKGKSDTKNKTRRK